MEDLSWLLLHEEAGESYDAVARTAAAAVGAERCHLALYDPEADQIIARRPRYTAPGRPLPQYRFPPTAASARVIRTGKPYLSNDPGSDPLYDPSVRENGVRSVLSVPLRHRNSIVGLLYALNKPGGFTPRDAAALRAQADIIAITFENIRLYTSERERRLLKESLCEISRTFVGANTQDAALASVLDQLGRVVRYEAAAAVLLEGELLRVAASRGGDTDVAIRLASAGTLREALEARQLAWLSDASALLAELGLRGVAGKALAAPLLAGEKVLGAFVVVFDIEDSPTCQDTQFVSAFAEHSAVFLEAGAALRRERKAQARAASVARITRIVATRHEPDSLLQAVTPELLGLVQADRAVLYLKQGRTSVLCPVATAGTEPGEEEWARGLCLDLASELLAPLAQGAHVAFQGDSGPPPGSIIAPFSNTRSLLGIPLVSRDEILGAVVFAWLGRSCACETPLVEFLMDVAQQVAVGVENARLFAALSQMASTDELTQLANRRRFAETFHLELARGRRTGAPLALIMADVDHLKRVNDTFGHPAGDAAIRHAADALKRGRREIDLAARLGGEEFALLLPGTQLVGAVNAAERIRRDLAGSTIAPVGTVTVSIGVAAFPQDGSEEEDLVRIADERLYAAKSGGRNQVCYITAPGGTPSSDPGPPTGIAGLPRSHKPEKSFPQA